MRESEIIEQQHPEAGLQLELVGGLERMRHLYDPELVDPIKKRVDNHNEDCGECRKFLLENIKFY